MLGVPALFGSIVGAVPGRFELVIIFAIGGIVAIIARATIGIRIGIAVAVVCLIAFEIAALVQTDDLADWAWTTFGVVVAGFIGYGRRQARLVAEQTRQLIETQRQLLDQAEETRAVEASNAALAERSRIARDLHDVLAHALGGLVVQLDAAEGQLSVNQDVDGASKRLRRARALAVEGLDDARRAVTALRTDAPGLSAALRAMVNAYDAGNARLTGDAGAANVPEQVTDALLAVVREALNNSRKHAFGADVTVWLRIDHEVVRVDVANDAGTAGDLAATGSGAGIAGMRERMDAVGGKLQAGPAAGGTWRVSASVPLGSCGGAHK
nr:histidine kinase [Spelaeicoccus albus]